MITIFKKINQWIPDLRVNFKIHLVFWSLFFLYLLWETEYLQGELYVALFDSFIYLIITAGLVYTNLFWLIPRFLYQGRYTGYFLLFFSFLIVGAYFKYYAYTYIIPSNEAADYSFTSLLFRWFFKTLFEVLAISSIQVIQDWASAREQLRKAETQRLEAELNFLKAQIHPHFLFNTLNNIYFLIGKQPNKAAESVIKLSEMLRYRLYGTNDKLLDVSNEIEHIKNYIDLQKLRYGDQFDVSLFVWGQEKHLVEPFILMEFVENCFKHCAPINEKEKGWVKIDFELFFDKMIFKTRNSKPEHVYKGIKEESRGIGLQNIRKSLDMLYANNYKLEIEFNNNEFSVSLTLYKN